MNNREPIKIYMWSRRNSELRDVSIMVTTVSFVSGKKITGYEVSFQASQSFGAMPRELQANY